MIGSAFEQQLAAAESHLAKNDLSAAEQACRRVLAERPNDARALMLSASVAAKRGDYDRSEALLDRLLKRDPRAVDALYLLGRVHWHAGRPRKALQSLTRGLQADFGLPREEGLLECWRLIVGGIASAAPMTAWHPRRHELAAFGAALERCGELVANQKLVYRSLAQVNPLAVPPAEASARLRTLIALSGFAKESAPNWNRALFERFLLAWLKQLLAAGRYDSGLMLEQVLLNEYVIQTETEAHFAATVGQWSEAMRAAGRQYGALQSSPAPHLSASPPKVAFFAHRLSSLAHVRLLLDALEGHAALPEPLIHPLIVCFWVSLNAELTERLERLGVEIVKLSTASPEAATVADYAALRAALVARDVDAVVWVSYVMGMSFAFSMRIAPVQIWWAMKYHSLEFDEIDGYLASGSVTGGKRRIGSREWRIGPIAAQDWFAPELAVNATAERARFAQHRVLYGCFGREEKLDSAPFLKAVATTLKTVPHAGFLWTGRRRHPAIQALLEAEGVAERCHFVGWVNTRLYAQVIDVFLDSFPFPCAYTLYEAMAAGKPAVLYASDESAHTGARSLIEPLLNGVDGSEDEQLAARTIFAGDTVESRFLVASSPEQYAAWAVRLGQDEGFRQAVGRAGRAFVERFMTDPVRCARIYGEHLAAMCSGANRT